MSSAPAIVWLRRDLRLRDNPALACALETPRPVVPVFLWDPEGDGAWAPGAASRWWLHHSLLAFDKALRRLGSRLVIRRGSALEVLRRLARETGAGLVTWNRRYEPAAIDNDTAVKHALFADGLGVRSFHGAVLFPPSRVQTQADRPFRVFTPFWNHCRSRPIRDEITLDVASLPAPEQWPESDPVDALELRPTIPWDREFRENWQPGEAGADLALESFLDEAMHAYATARDRPAQRGTSRLSPHLHWGEISPVQVFHAVRNRAANGDAEAFLREVGWREFAVHLLFHFPQTTTEPLRQEFARFPWSDDWSALRAWQCGQTGFPIVDAGMRELWRTGWMHNRVRMIVASFLVKHLLQSWQAGARWFWDTLVDADLAANTLGWQWIAGCGADAAPYFRIFNPMLQGAKFDPAGEYVRRWVPELGAVPAGLIHAPWEAPEPILRDAGVELGKTYPRPIIDHKDGRARALAAYHRMRDAK